MHQLVPTFVVLTTSVWLIAAIGSSWPWLVGGAVVTAVVTLFVGRVLQQRALQALSDLATAADHLARGELSPKLAKPDVLELAAITERFNGMADVIEQRLRALLAQSSEQRAVLASMSEGVIAIDLQQRVISLNRAAAELLNFAQGLAAGRPLQEVIRNADLRRFVTQALASDDPISG
ncbi:MAG: PAS domain-containing protein, partial [Planctomycetaceae bacterium]|nr:PAS domain-containing protein [Planctomycetaceae bacterium]